MRANSQHSGRSTDGTQDCTHCTALHFALSFFVTEIGNSMSSNPNSRYSKYSIYMKYQGYSYLEFLRHTVTSEGKLGRQRTENHEDDLNPQLPTQSTEQSEKYANKRTKKCQWAFFHRLAFPARWLLFTTLVNWNQSNVAFCSISSPVVSAMQAALSNAMDVATGNYAKNHQNPFFQSV